MTTRSSGDAKWYFAPVSVKPNTSYTFSDWYNSNIKTTVDVVVTSTTGTQSYLWQGDPASSANAWKQVAYTFTTPANASKLTVYHSLSKVGQLTVDDYSLTDNTATTPAPTAPTVTLTSPANGATVSGTTALTATASDAQSVSSVQFKVDGNNVGVADITAPYSLDWDSKTVTNGAHSITAVATNAADLSTPSTAATVTVNNTVTPTTPVVSLTAPTNGSTVSGSTTVSATVSDTTPIAGVQFKLDGTNLGTEDTTAPYSVNWDTKAATNSSHTLTAVARNTSGGTGTSAPTTVTVNNVVTPTPPTVSLTAPVSGATVSGTTSLTAAASDAKAVSSVQFKLDGVNVGTATTSPYSVSWNSKTVTDGSHTVTAVATNSDGLATTSSPVTVTVSNPTAPTVSMSSPLGGSSVSSTVSVSASASDAKSITSVQFKLDGANLGSPITTSPYSTSWDTTKVANGSHTLSAVATNSSNLSTTSTPISVTVNNVVVTPPAATNLLANPSFETANGTAPANWIASNWGTNTSTFTYQTTGRTGTHSAKAQITSYTNGSANWYYDEVPVTAGKTYLYSNWYQSNVDTEVDAEVTMADGTVQYYWLGNVSASTAWAQYKNTFTVPVGAKSMAVYQILAKVGYLVTDDYSLTEYTPVPYNRGIVTVTFDDGWQNQYTNALPILNQLGIKSTFYIISGELNDTPDYMTSTQVKDLYTQGNEIGSHSVSHPDLTTLTATQLTNQMKNSQSTLQTLIGAPVTNFAYPFGAYNATTIAEGQKYYATQRSVDRGLNTRDNLDLTKLKIQEIDSDTTNAQVQAWIDQAVTENAWLILCYHEIANTPAVADDALYTTKIADFQAQMTYLKGSGASVQTLKSALAEVQAQQ
jgi:peptidoglycan/xylan/chitin deacetylase (PgdA/CDA1 family)